LNKNFIIAGAVILVLGLAIAIGVTLSSEPVAAGLPEGETTVTGDLLPEFAGENDDNIASAGLELHLDNQIKVFNKSIL